MIRDATAGDMAAVAAIYAREVREGTATFEDIPPSTETLVEHLSGVQRLGLPWLVAEIDGEVAAYAYASPFRPRAAYRYAVETSIYVGEGFQGQGLGRALMQTIIDQCRDIGLRQMIAAISNDESDASVILHEGLGFRPAGIYRRAGWKFGRWLDVTLMQLDLAPTAGPPDTPGLSLG
ncbi:MAG: N-acetyltransferase [Caulobacterales bacterium]|nr:N-acetyltransferase [Caulobacterales bacterium]